MVENAAIFLSTARQEAEEQAEKEARRSAPDYNPTIVLMSPFEDPKLVLAQYQREHLEPGDHELVVYAIVKPRSELCTPTSLVVGEKWEAEAVARPNRLNKEAAEKHRREIGEMVSELSLDADPVPAEPQDEPMGELPVEEPERKEPPRRRYNGPAWQRGPFWWMSW